MDSSPKSGTSRITAAPTSCFYYIFIACLAAALHFECSAGPSGLPLMLASRQSGRKIDESEGGSGQAVLYRLKIERRRWRKFEKEGGEIEWRELQTSEEAESCDPADPCDCPGENIAEAALVFIPDRVLGIQWQAKKGEPGFYKTGMIVQEGEDWRYEGEAPGEDSSCEISRINWNHMHSLLDFAVHCRWEEIEEGCRGEDIIELRFNEPLQQSVPPPEEKTWDSEYEGEVFRYGDDLESRPGQTEPPAEE